MPEPQNSIYPGAGGGHLRAGRQSAGLGGCRLRQDPRVGRARRRAYHRPGPPGGREPAVHYDLHQRRRGQAARRHHDPPGAGGPRPPRRSASASPADAVAACIHRHSGCVLPAFCAAELCVLDVPPDFTMADDANLARLQQETLAAALETAYQDPDFRAFADLYDRGRHRQYDRPARSRTSTTLPERYPHPAQSLQRFVAMWQRTPHRKRVGRPFCGQRSARIALALSRTVQNIAGKRRTVTRRG